MKSLTHIAHKMSKNKMYFIQLQSNTNMKFSQSSGIYFFSMKQLLCNRFLSTEFGKFGCRGEIVTFIIGSRCSSMSCARACDQGCGVERLRSDSDSDSYNF